MNALTIDVEDWYQLANKKLLGRSVLGSQRVLTNTHLVLDMLAAHDVCATFFVLGTIAKQFPGLVLRIRREGHEVATHGFTHTRVTNMRPVEFAADLHRSIQVLEDIIQEPVLGYRAPEFSLNASSAWAFEILAEAGIRYDSSVFPVRHPRYGYPNAPQHPYRVVTPSGTIMEFPLATARYLGQNVPIAGGGYLRVFPLPFIRRGVEQMNRRGHAAILYLHPYELDEEWLDLPIQTRSARRRLALHLRALKRNWGRGHPMRIKLEILLESCSFEPLRELMHSDSRPALLATAPA